MLSYHDATRDLIWVDVDLIGEISPFYVRIFVVRSAGNGLVYDKLLFGRVQEAF